MKKSIRRVFWLYFLLFAALVAYLAKFIVFDAGTVVNSPLNPRVSLEKEDVVRGDILDAQNRVIASGAADARTYPYGRLFAHAVGCADKNHLSGIEAKFNFELENPHLEVIQRIGRLLTGAPVKGNSLVLTLDADVQQAAYDALGGRKGAVVVLEPSTGKVLAMVSYPNFDPNTIAADWDKLRGDTDNSPLLNRASQGMYPPGSVFKIITALAALQSLPDVYGFEYDCKGSGDFGGRTISCFNGTAHGREDIKRAFAVSCNTFFAALGLRVGPRNLRSAAEAALFNSTLDFSLEHGDGSFPLDAGAGGNEIVETAIGQGRTMTTPLQMALVAAAVANGGIMMKPYVVDRELTAGGYETGNVMPEMLRQAMSAEQARALTEMMTGAVENGTGRNAAPDGVTMAGKTGSAQNPNGADHGWFVGFAPADKPAAVVCVLGENIGGSSKVLGMAKSVMEKALEAENRRLGSLQ
ncbi:MAG: penicillin-binding transpeptidase domain-containing protein [Firmicutes bacterium]|nr:penicillin-binding transpeptidase domain-containing protein [Bacillota bacterium]